MQYILNETEWEDISALKLRVFAYWNDYHPYHSAGGGGLSVTFPCLSQHAFDLSGTLPNLLRPICH